VRTLGGLLDARRGDGTESTVIGTSHLAHDVASAAPLLKRSHARHANTVARSSIQSTAPSHRTHVA
jgi:hypothetical protein